jgi:hypothetical protein
MISLDQNLFFESIIRAFFLLQEEVVRLKPTIPFPVSTQFPIFDNTVIRVR